MGNDGNGWISRLGVRVHRTWVNEEGRRTQPYVTVNWWHSSVDGAVGLNNVTLGQLYPDDRYEVKLGVNVERGRGWTGGEIWVISGVTSPIPLSLPEFAQS